MSYPRKHRRFSRIAFGLALASVMFVGRASVSPARIDPGTQGSGFVKAGGWSGMVDLESGVPLSAGIPQGDEQFIGEQANDVIPYLSHGILTQAQADDVAQAGDDPYLTDIHVRPGESLGGPDGGPVVTRPQATRAQEPKPDANHTQRVWTDRD